MHRPALDADELGTFVAGQRMDLGFFDDSTPGLGAFGHEGDTQVFHSAMRMFPEHDTGIFLAVNGNGHADGSLDLRATVLQGFADRYLRDAAAADSMRRTRLTRVTLPPWLTRVRPRATTAVPRRWSARTARPASRSPTRALCSASAVRRPSRPAPTARSRSRPSPRVRHGVLREGRHRPVARGRRRRPARDEDRGSDGDADGDQVRRSRGAPRSPCCGRSRWQAAAAAMPILVLPSWCCCFGRRVAGRRPGARGADAGGRDGFGAGRRRGGRDAGCASRWPRPAADPHRAGRRAGGRRRLGRSARCGHVVPGPVVRRPPRGAGAAAARRARHRAGRPGRLAGRARASRWARDRSVLVLVSLVVFAGFAFGFRLFAPSVSF